jgi:hypothetical protein
MAVYSLGLNFSHREAVRLGLDPEEAFQAVLIHLKPTHLRLSLYWDEAAPRAGTYDLSGARWFLDQAQRRDSHVLLTVGFKPQRHPSYYPPNWLAPSAASDTNTQAQGRLTANLLMMLERAIALLADYDAIDSWEVEHLPFLPANKQPPGWSIGAPLLKREIGVVHDVDPRHRPVVVSHPGGNLLGSGWRQAVVNADALGCTLFASDFGGSSGGLGRWLAWQLSIQASLAARFGKQLWVTELAAPARRQTNGAAPPLQRLDSPIEAAFRAGAARIYLSGVEEWLAMRDRGRPEQWEHTRALLQYASEELP